MAEEDAQGFALSEDRADGESESVTEAPHRSSLHRLSDAVLAVAKCPTRAEYTTWMPVVKSVWILPLLLLLVGLNILDGVITSVIRTLLITPGTHDIPYRFGTPSFIDQLIYALVISPLIGVISLAVVIFLGAALMPAEKGSLKDRAFQLARPYLLALVVVSLITLLISDPLFVLGLTALGQNPLIGIVVSLANLATAIYFLIATLNALAAGSGRSRWLLFGVSVLAGIVSVAIGWYGLGILLYRFGIHLPVVL